MVGGVYQPIVIAEPYPVMGAVVAETLVLNLQCALPEGATAQDLTNVNVNLVQNAEGFQVYGVFNDATNQSQNMSAQATGNIDEMVNLLMPEGDEIYLQAVQQDGVTYYQGSIKLLGRADKSNLVCQLTQVKQ